MFHNNINNKGFQMLIKNAKKSYYKEKFKEIAIWAVVNLNSNRTCSVCTGLSDNSLY